MIGQYIKSLRLLAGLTQRELARDVGISTSMLSLLEAGKRQPTIRMLKDLATALELPTASIFAVALADEEVPTRRRKTGRLIQNLTQATRHSVSVRKSLRTKLNNS